MVHDSSWVVQPVKKCIKHYTYKNSHILWMFAVHHNFVVTFLQHKLKKIRYPDTHTCTLSSLPLTHELTQTHGQKSLLSRYTPSQGCGALRLSPVRHGRSGLILRVVHHLQGLMPLAGEREQRNPH